MSETETLYCEVGHHEWSRPRVQGRKPKSCPKHPVKPKRSKPFEKAQYAEIQSPGVAKLADGQMVVLANPRRYRPGDVGMAEWSERRWHFILFEAAASKPAPPTPTPLPPPRPNLTLSQAIQAEGKVENALTRAKVKKRPTATPETEGTRDHLEAIIAQHHPTAEAEAQLRYIHKELMKGTRDEDDITMLTKRRKAIERQLKAR